MSVFLVLDRSKVIYATEGKDSSTVESFKTDLCEHQGDPDKVEDIYCDMSPAFIKRVTTCFPGADITFDKFHVLKIINAAVDKVRRQEQKDQPMLKNTRYIFLKNPENLTHKKADTIEQIKHKDLNLKTVREFQIRPNFQEFWKHDPGCQSKGQRKP